MEERKRAADAEKQGGFRAGAARARAIARGRVGAWARGAGAPAVDRGWRYCAGTRADKWLQLQLVLVAGEQAELAS